MARKTFEEGEIETQRVYEIGTPVSIKSYDGTYTNGEITKVDRHGYTIKWEHGQTYIVGAHDGELHQMVENSILQGQIPKGDDIGYNPSEEMPSEEMPSEVMETKKSPSWTKESTIVVFFVVVIFAIAVHVRRKKLFAISSTRKSDGGIWGANIQNGTNLSLQMDEHRNLRNVRNIM